MLSWRERERIKTEETLRRSLVIPESTWRSFLLYSPLISTLISTMALVISLISFYYTTLYEHRALSVAIPLTEHVRFTQDNSSKRFTPQNHFKINFSITPVFNNDGNHYEVVLGVWLSLGTPEIFRASHRIGPFVLKGGESLPVKVDMRYPKKTKGWSATILSYLYTST